MIGQPYIPSTITVHLGSPDSNAQNAIVPFPDYIKNVASSEIYPTWPEAALRANIYVQISFALNRIYTEWYPSRGYDFDITNVTQYDQKFINNRNIFDNISNIVDEIFNSYIVRQGDVEPLFTSYCSGRGTNCQGLKQWDTVALAEQGKTPYEILQYYYGNDIDIVSNAPVRINSPSYPGRVLRQGDSGNSIQQMQIRLNRIARNYPAIPTVDPNGVFGKTTEDAVQKFQSVFGLTVDGLVGSATWYRIGYIYTSVKKLAELASEGLEVDELPQKFSAPLRLGDSGDDVFIIQYYLSVLSRFYDTVPNTVLTGTFDEQTLTAVTAFQKEFGLSADGIVGRATWNAMYNAYRGIIMEEPFGTGQVTVYPGYVLSFGSQGDAVLTLQKYLQALSAVYTSIPAITPDGQFGSATENAVRAAQQQFGLTVNGIVGPVTWDAIAGAYADL